jgi:hypothetical protein
MKRKLDKVTFSKIKNGESIIQPEWCFQFNNDKPVVFAAHNEPNVDGDTNLILEIPANTLSNVVFQQGENTFTIFPREMTREGRILVKKNKSKSEK